MSDFDFQQLYNDMPFRKKVSLFLHQNHFLFWKITLMDVTIVIPLFFLMAYTLDRCTSLGTGYAVLIAACICGIIEHFRIRYRRVKTYQNLSDQVGHVRQLLEQYAEVVDRSGNEEQKRKAAETLKKIEDFNKMVEGMADVVFKEDLLGFSEKEEQ